MQILLNNNDYLEAIDLIKSIDKFEEFSKKESRWGIFLADAYYEMGKEELAIIALQDYLQYSPKDLYLNEYYVRVLTLQKKYDEAIKHYRFMSANKLISFSDIETSKKMALLNIEAKKFVLNQILHNKEILSIDYHNIISPWRVPEIPQLMLGMSINDLTQQTFYSTIHKVIIENTFPDIIKMVPDQKYESINNYKAFPPNKRRWGDIN